MLYLAYNSSLSAFFIIIVYQENVELQMALYSFSLITFVCESVIGKRDNVIDLQFKSKVRYMSFCLLIHLDPDFFLFNY